MKKIINNPGRLVDEMVKGIPLAHPDQVYIPGDGRCVLVRTDSPALGRVGIVTGGGSGHLLLFRDYVGKGLCSGAVIGSVFSSPSAQWCTDTARAVGGEADVLFLYGDYGGDVLNFDLAVDLLELDGVETRIVLDCDDVASQSEERAKGRRGVTGILSAYKATGAAAEYGGSLDRVATAAQKVVDNTAAMGVGLSPTTLSVTGVAFFDPPGGEMGIGIDIHDEPGIYHGPLGTTDEIADQILDSVILDLGLAEGGRVAILVNGLGATPLEEFYLLYRRTHRGLVGLGVAIERRYIGEHVAPLEMAGVPISLLKVDDGLLELPDTPAQSPFFKEA